MADREKGLSTYHTMVLFAMRVFAGCIGIFTLLALLSQILGGRRLISHDLSATEVFVFLAGNAFMWLLVKIYPFWARFLEGNTRL